MPDHIGHSVGQARALAQSWVGHGAIGLADLRVHHPRSREMPGPVQGQIGPHPAFEPIHPRVAVQREQSGIGEVEIQAVLVRDQRHPAGIGAAARGGDHLGNRL